MHELSLVTNLVRKVEAIAREQNAQSVVSVKVRVGALSHLSPSHLREHFTRAAEGTLAAGARLDVETLTDISDPHAQEILLGSVELKT